MMFLMTFFLHLWAGAAAATRCAVCGMDVHTESKTSYEVEYNGKTSRVCSFGCASKLGDRHPGATFKVKDYTTGTFISAKDAVYLINSKALADEVSFGMPPVVAAFGLLQRAEETKKRLGDGETVKGFDAVRLRFK